MRHYERSLSSSCTVCRRTAGAATVATGRNHPCRAIQKMQSYMAIGSRLQHRRIHRNCRFALHQRAQMGETVSVRWPRWSSRPSPSWPTEDLHEKDRKPCDRKSHLSAAGLGAGVHHMVVDETGKASAATSGTGIDQSRNDSSYSRSSRPSVPHRTNMVREQRSRIRGKKNAIVGLYRNPPKRGHVVCFDEMGPLQTIPRGGKAWGKRSQKRPDRYKRNGTLQWFCAFSPISGKAGGKGSSNKSADSCREFWVNRMMAFWSTGSIHLVMDNLSAHKKALRELPAKIRRRLHVYWTPTNSSRLNLIESYFATLERTALHNTYYKTPNEIEQALQNGVQYLNENPQPYKWKKI